MTSPKDEDFAFPQFFEAPVPRKTIRGKVPARAAILPLSKNPTMLAELSRVFDKESRLAATIEDYTRLQWTAAELAMRARKAT